MVIWVTGVGVVSPLGPTAPDTMAALLAGKRAFGPLTLFELPGARSQIAAQVAPLDVDVPGLAPGEQASRTDAMAIVAAREALAAAGLDDGARPVDLVVGGTASGLYETEGYLAELVRDSTADGPLGQMLSHPLSSTVDRMRLAWGGYGRSRTVCSACSSGANAIALGATWLATGRSERVLAGGADGLCRLSFAGFHALSVLSPEPCRPFDRRRRGLSLGEGAAFLVLETRASAQARGARPIVELRGWAVGSECHHIIHPEPSARTIARLLGQAVRSAGLSPRDVGYVNAHGTGTVLNDAAEVAGLVGCFGGSIGEVALSSNKGQLGHSVGAAGAIEAAVTVMALERGELPATAGLAVVDSACEGPRHLLAPERRPIAAALSSSFGFGGTDTVLAFAALDAFPPAEPPRARRAVVISAAATLGSQSADGGTRASAYLDPGPLPKAGPIAFDPAAHLDVQRARHVDRVGRMVVAACRGALRVAGITPPSELHPGTELGHDDRFGAIVGSAYGSVDGAATFVRRVLDRGARGAVPAVFPNLVPSSPVAHAAIYLGLGGPVLAVSELGTTAEMAAVTAMELIAAGEADRMLAGSVDEHGVLAQRTLARLHGDRPGSRVATEGVSVVLLEALDEHPRAPSALPAESGRCAEIVVAFASSEPAEELARRIPPPHDPSRSMTVVPHATGVAAAIVAASSWSTVPRRSVAERAGDHAALGGFALAAAVEAIQLGSADEALVVGASKGRRCVLLLRARPAVATVERRR